MKTKFFAMICALSLLLCSAIANASIKPQNLVVSTPSGIIASTAMNIGDTLQLHAKASPDGASIGTIAWKSSKTSVAKVSADGFVVARKAGKTVVSAISKKWKKTGKITITVIDPTMPTEIIIDQKGTSILYMDQKLVLSATMRPSSAKSDILWHSANTRICTVSKVGVVTPKKEGITTIIAKTKRGRKVSRLTVRVVDPFAPSSIEILANKPTVMYRGEQLQFICKLSMGWPLRPDQTENPNSYKFKWSTSNKKVVSVVDGLVLAKAKGKAKITAKCIIGGKSDTVLVYVK